MKTLCVAFSVVAVLAGGVADAQTPPSPPPSPGVRVPAPPSPPAGVPILPEELATPAKLINVRIGVIVIEEGGGQPAARKDATLILGDRRSGSVRSAALQQEAGNHHQAQLSIDARPWVESDGRVRTAITLDYVSHPYFSNWGRLKFEPLLDSGKPLVAAEASSAIADRRIRVEVTATILK